MTLRQLNSLVRDMIKTYSHKISLKTLSFPNFKNFNKTRIKEHYFHLTENPFTLAGMNNSLKNIFSIEGKTFFTARNI